MEFHALGGIEHGRLNDMFAGSRTQAANSLPAIRTKPQDVYSHVMWSSSSIFQ